MIALISSCKTQKVSSDIEVPENTRREYYRPFYESTGYRTNIYALTDVNSVYKAANNFTLNETYIVDALSDSIYLLKPNIEKRDKSKADVLRDALIAAGPDDIDKFRKLKKFLDSNEYAERVYFTGIDSNAGKWNVYFIYSTAVSEKLKQEKLLLTRLADIKSLNILDLSATIKE
jgi:hypothetical protein